MKKIFIGLLFIFFDFNLTINAHVIGLIPDFVGYIILMKGVEEMLDESPWFGKIKPWALGMAIFTAVLYVMALLGFTQAEDSMPGILDIIAGVVYIYITYNLVRAVKDMEEKNSYSLNGENLRLAWICTTVIGAIGYIPNLWGLLFMKNMIWLMGATAVILAIAGFVAKIYFLFLFNTSKNLYYDMKQSAGSNDENNY